MRKLAFLLLTWMSAHAQAPSALRVDLLRQPERVLVHSRFPAFTWDVATPVQTAYQIVVASDGAAVWNSGRRAGRTSAGVLYEGPALQPDTRYSWKVRTWDGAGKAGEYSAPQTFHTGEKLEGFGLPSFALVKTIQQAKEAGDVYDFGKDAFAQPRITVTASTPDTLDIRLGEALTPDGRIDTAPPGSVRYRLIKVPLLPGTHTYDPPIPPDKRNTAKNAVLMPAATGEVLPFRYMEVAGADSASRYMVTGPFDDSSTVFTSSDTALNKVWDLCKYTIKATSFSGYYVDGDRERIPYEADALIAQLSQYASDADFTMAERTLDYLVYHPTWPTEWSLQNILIAWNDYLYSGDLRLVRQLYPELKNKLLGSLAGPDGLISTRTGKQTPEFLASIHAGAPLKDIVDWPPPHFGGPNEKVGEQDGFVFTDYNSVVNAFYYEDLRIMARLAGALGKYADAKRYEAESARVRTAFQRAFVSTDGLVVDGEGTTHSSLHANMFAVAFGLVPPDKVLPFIRSRGMACSVYGAQFLLDALASAGDAGYALQLITSTDKRSWLNMLREGATMTMEAWGQEYKPNQDWCHAWGTAPANYIVRHFAGIEPLTPGFGEVQIKPQPGNVASASLRYRTIRGVIEERFENKRGRFCLWLTLPGNTVGRVCLPGGRVINGVTPGRHYYEVRPAAHAVPYY